MELRLQPFIRIGVTALVLLIVKMRLLLRQTEWRIAMTLDLTNTQNETRIRLGVEAVRPLAMEF